MVKLCRPLLAVNDIIFNFNLFIQNQMSATSKFVYCPDHPDEIITNFCSCINCLKPLCPECMQIHNIWHKEQGTYPEIESIKNVNRQCNQKLKSAIQALQQEIQNCQHSTGGQNDISDIFDQLIRYKKRILDLVNSYIQSLEETIQQQLQESNSKPQKLEPTVNKMKQFIGELQYLLGQLEEGEQLNTIRKVCNMDVQHIISKYRAEINKTQTSSDNNNIQLKFDEPKLYYFKQELEQLISIQQKEGLNYNIQNQQNYKNQYQQQQYSQYQPVQQKPIQQQAQQKQMVTQQVTSHQIQSTGSTGSHFQSFNQAPPSVPFQIQCSDFFEASAQRKFLHFFQNDDNKLHLIDLIQLQQKNLLIKTVTLNISFKVPSFHKSIATPKGDLFLTGGTIPDGTMAKSGFIYQYLFNEEKLAPLSVMNYPRSSHGICYLNNYIYLVGGYEHKHVMTKKCERYNIKQKKFELLSNLNFPATSLSLCTFGNQYIFKFGGIGEGYEGHLLSPYVERYDVELDKWTVIDPKISKYSHSKLGQQFGLLSTSASVQINSEDIFIFGGYLEDNSGSNQSFLFSTTDKNLEASENIYYIKEVNAKPLTHQEAFWNNIPIIHDNRIYVLQNIAGENSDNCLENERRIIIFDGSQWQHIN